MTHFEIEYHELSKSIGNVDVANFKKILLNKFAFSIKQTIRT